MECSVGDEPFLPFRAAQGRPTEARRVRSTLIASSIQALKRRGLYDDYFAHLPVEERDAIAACVAGSWLPMATGLAHYGAIDAIGLADQLVAEMSADVSTQTQATFLATAAKLATSAGATPWTALAQFQRLWDRILDGGDCAVGRAGPKDARLEVVGLPLFRVRYFRFAFRFYTLTLCRLFATSCYVNEVPKGGGPTFGTFRVAWA